MTVKRDLPTVRWIGRTLVRREDERLVRGEGKFADDADAQGCLHVAFARSPHAHATITSLDTVSAQAGPDVVRVLTGTDVAHLNGPPPNELVEGMVFPDMPILARNKVLAVGQPVMAIFARSRAAAMDAIEEVSVDYDALAPVPDHTVSPDTPDLFESIPRNQVLEQTRTTGQNRQVSASTEFRVSASVQHSRLAPTSLEPRGIYVEWRANTESVHIRLSTQTPHRARKDLAKIIGVDETRISVTAVDVGGAFGMKASLYPEEILVAWSAFHLKKSVKWVSTRSEDLLAATHGRGAATRGEVTCSATGKIESLEATVEAPLGCWLPYSAAVPAWNAGRILPGPYDVDTVSATTSAHLSNTAPVGIYRGAGRPEAALLMERLVDKAAHACGQDAMAFRRHNLLASDRFPLARSDDVVLDSGQYTAALDKACELSGYDQLRRDQDTRRERGKHVGIGISCYIEPSGRGWESARIRLEKDGRFTLMTGSSAQGQGRETAYAQVAADVLGINPEDITVRHGDTDTCPAGIGALASRSTAIGGSAVHAAAHDLIARAEVRVECANWADVADRAQTPLEGDAIFETPSEAWGFGCYVAVVNVDIETGVLEVEHIWCVDDAGVIVNPLLAEGQIVGGIAQGLGEVMMERIVYDEEGQLLTGSFMDYALPRATDMPPVTLANLETPAPFNPLGAKGLGEAGTIGAPPAILNAAVDALRPLGVEDLQMPLTSETIWQAIRSASKERPSS